MTENRHLVFDAKIERFQCITCQSGSAAQRLRLECCGTLSQEGFVSRRSPCLPDERDLQPGGPVKARLSFARAIGRETAEGGRAELEPEAATSQLLWRTRSSSSRDILVVTNNSCLAPLERAIAFQPVWVGVVTRIFTGPFASRTLRIRPGMIVAMDEQFPRSLSRTGRSPSIIECSTFRRLLAARSLIGLACGLDAPIRPATDPGVRDLDPRPTAATPDGIMSGHEPPGMSDSGDRWTPERR